MIYKRTLFNEIERNLDNDYFLIIVGARQTGKTSLLMYLKTYLEKRFPVTYISLEDPYYLNLLNEHPQNLLEIIEKKKKEFVLIDEIQYLKNPTNFLKYHYDFNRSSLKIIATGSSAFYIDERFKDSLAGRKRIFTLYPLSLEEVLTFKQIDIPFERTEKGFLKYPLKFRNQLLEILKEILIYGSYPAVVLETNKESKKEILKDLVDSYTKKDISETNIKEFDIYYNFLRLLASQTGNLLSLQDISNTLNISYYKAQKYLQVGKKYFHFTLLPPYFKNIRSEISKTPKVYFYDCGLKNALLRRFEPLSIREDKGALFENFIFNYFGHIYGFENIKYWRTKSKNEIDFVINEQFAVECKFSDSGIKLGKYGCFLKNYKMPLYFAVFEKRMNRKQNNIRSFV